MDFYVNPHFYRETLSERCLEVIISRLLHPKTSLNNELYIPDSKLCIYVSL